MYVVVGYHGLENQCIVVRMANVTRFSFTEGDIFRLTSSLLGRLLVGRAHGRNLPFPSLSEVAILGSSHLPSEVWFAEDTFDFARRSCLVLVLAGLGAPIADIVLKVSLSDELLDLLLKGDVFFRGVADISVVSAVFALVSFRAISPHRIWSLVYACVLRGQEDILTRRCQVGEVIVLARRGSRDPLIWAIGLLLVGVQRLSEISAFAFLVVPILLGRHELSCWCDLMWRFYRS